jgi:hypothetical protein
VWRFIFHFLSLSISRNRFFLFFPNLPPSLLPTQNTEIDPTLFTIIRSAFIGLCASSISDICSNSLRVLKTSKQAGNIEKTVIKSEIKNETLEENVGVEKEKKLINLVATNSEIKEKKKTEEINNGFIVKSTAIDALKNTEIVSKSYLEIAREIIEAEGLGGLFGRGLQVGNCYVFKCDF